MLGKDFGTQKLSEAVLEFAEPLLAAAPNRASQEAAINSAILIWNLALVPDDQAKELRQAFIDRQPPNDPSEGAELNALLDELLARKRALFPSDKRFIVQHELRFSGNDVSLFVASTPL